MIDEADCRATCANVHIDRECRSRCMKLVRDQSSGAGFRANAEVADALHTAQRAEAASVFTDYLAAQRRIAHGG